MKNLTILFAFIFSCFTISVTAQKTIWMNRNFEQVSKENSSYYRPTPKKVKNGYWVVNYYKNGNTQMEGFSTSKTFKRESFEGLVVHYFNNETPSKKLNYKNGKLDGVVEYYYESGELKEQGKYKEGKKHGSWKTFLKNGKIQTKGRYVDDEKVGVWKTFYKNVY